VLDEAIANRTKSNKANTPIKPIVIGTTFLPNAFDVKKPESSRDAIDLIV
jgi:hypothetical protein